MPKISKFRRNRKDRSGLTSNPPMAVDLVQFIAPGFGSFAATRFFTKIATAQLATRYPRYAKHAGAAAAVGSFLAAWFGAHRVRHLEKYHHPIVIGAGLAALESLIQIYLPKLGMFIGDPLPQVPASSPRPLLARRPAAAAAIGSLPDGWTSQSWASYNDAFDEGGYADAPTAPVPSVVDQNEDGADIDSLLSDDDDGDGDGAEAYS